DRAAAFVGESCARSLNGFPFVRMDTTRLCQARGEYLPCTAGQWLYVPGHCHHHLTGRNVPLPCARTAHCWTRPPHYPMAGGRKPCDERVAGPTRTRRRMRCARLVTGCAAACGWCRRDVL